MIFLVLITTQQIRKITINICTTKIYHVKLRRYFAEKVIPVKIKDIARLANVSTSAVSLALNGKSGISDRKRIEILEIAKKNNYLLPSQNRKQKEPHNNKLYRFVAFKNEIVTDSYDNQPFFMDLIFQVESFIQNSGSSLLISSLELSNYKYLAQLESEQTTEGLIVLGTNLERKHLQFLQENFANVTILDMCEETIGLDFVAINNVKGAYDATKYLLDKGHTKIGYAASSSRIYNFLKRNEGVKLALEEKELTIDLEHFFEMPFSQTSINHDLEFKINALKKTKNLPTAIFCECDYIAISVIKTLQKVGLHIPRDISVIGFDDIQEAQVVNPELSTVHVSIRSMAEAVTNSLTTTTGNKVTKKVFLDTYFVERESS